MSKLKQLRTNALARNTLWMMFGHGGRIGLYGLYFVLAARWLGAEGLGVFAGALALTKILQPFAAMGSDQVLARRVSRAREEYPSAMGDALVVTFVTGAAFCLLAVLLSGVVFVGKVPWELMVTVTVAELMFYRLQCLVRRVFQAVDRLGVTAVVKAIPGPALLVAVVLFKLTSAEATVEAWGYWYLAGTALPSVVAVAYTFASLGRPTFRFRESFRVMREGFFFSLGESAKVAYTDGDKILLLRLFSEQVAGVYKAAYRIVSVCMVPVLALIDASYARFFRTGADGVKGSYRFAVRLMPISVVYGGVVAAGIWLVAPIMPIVLGPSYASSVEVLRWIAPIPVIQGASYLLLQTITGGGHQRARSLLETSVAVANAGLNFLLIPLYSWRASAGVAVASEALILLGSFLLARWLSRIPVRSAARSDALRDAASPLAAPPPQ